MKIGIDARMCGPGQAGLGRYIQQLILNLEKVDSQNEYVIFLRRENWDEYKPSQSNFKKVLADISWYSWQEQVKLKKIVKKENLDLMHFPHWNIPLTYNDPFVVTIHDLIMYHYARPEATTLGPVKFWLKDKLHRLVIRHAVKKARHVIAVSEFTKEDIHNTLKVPLEKVTVTYQSPHFPYPISHIPSSDEVLRKFGIEKPFLLYVGNAYPHKNLEGLLQAWKIFEEKYSKDYQLVLVGKDNHFYKNLKSNTLINKLTNKPNFIGFVEDADLPALYHEASLYVFPSLYEGFGLPPLEAMSHGVPVASSNRTCLPEVLGEAALYFDPENYKQMAEVIHQGLIDEDLRFELKQKGKEQLGLFSGEELARKTLDIYKH